MIITCSNKIYTLYTYNQSAATLITKVTETFQNFSVLFSSLILFDHTFTNIKQSVVDISQKQFSRAELDHFATNAWRFGSYIACYLGDPNLNILFV